MDIEKAIKRVLNRLHPELFGALHLPQWGRVVAVHEIDNSVESSASEPLYCIDVQVLNRQGANDEAVPILSKVPLPAPGAGDVRGIFCYPKMGALVEFGFIFGQPNKPFIRTVFIEQSTPPTLKSDEIVIAKDADNYYKINNDNNIAERCQNIAERIAKTKQRLVVNDGGKMWLGNDSDNALTLLSDLMGEVIKIANALASHNHPFIGKSSGSPGITEPPINAPVYSGASSATEGLQGKLDAFKE